MLNDEELAALDTALRTFAATGDGDGMDEVAFAAGIAYAQKWRSMESAPKPHVRILATSGIACAVIFWNNKGWRVDWNNGPFEPTGWLPLPPTEAK